MKSINDLPTEALNEIFLWLDQEQKAECVHVCRRWKDIINAFALYQTVEINTTHQLLLLMETLRHDPTRIPQIERVLFDMSDLGNFDTASLPAFFPRARVLYFYSSKVLGNIETNWDQEPWINRVEHLVECMDCGITSVLLTSNVFSYLKRLTVESTESILISANTIVEHLHNAPVLEVLTMRGFEWTLTCMERLHGKVPTLTSIELVLCFDEEDTLPTTITAAPAVTSLQIRFGSASYDAHFRWLQYIRRKYQSLTCLAFENYSMRYNLIDNAQGVYTEGVLPLVQKFSPHLKTLSMCLNTFQGYLFDRLDIAETHLTTLKIRAQMLSPLNPMTHLHHLHSLHILASSVFNCEWLTSFPCLKELGVECVRDDFGSLHLDSFAAKCPATLESLSLTQIRIENHHKVKTKLPIKRLTLDSIVLPDKVDGFISDAMPQLQTLKLFRVLFKTLNLPHQHLSYFEYTVPQRFEAGGFQIKTLDDKRTHWYRWEKHLLKHAVMEEEFGIQKSMFYKELEKRTIPFPLRTEMMLVCASLRCAVLKATNEPNSILWRSSVNSMTDDW